MFTKTIQVSKLIFDIDTLKVGEKIKYFEKWTRYDVNYEDGYINGIEEIDCIIKEVSENNLTLVEINDHSDYLKDREIVYHNIYRLKADDNYKIELIENEVK
jgi:protein tyrosine/serine phosphatase